MLSVADRLFVSACPPETVPDWENVKVFERMDDIAFSELAEGEYSLFVGEEVDEALDALMRTQAYDLRLLAVGAPNRRVLAWASAWWLDPCRPPPLDGSFRIREYLDKEAALEELQHFLVSTGTQSSFVDGITMAVDECVLNAVFDADPELSVRPRSQYFRAARPVDAEWYRQGPLVVVSVRDHYGRFARRDFGTAVAHRFLDAGERAGPGMNIGIATMMRYCGGVFVEVEAERSSTVHLVSDTSMRFSHFLRGGRMAGFRESAASSV